MIKLVIDIVYQRLRHDFLRKVFLPKYNREKKISLNDNTPSYIRQITTTGALFFFLLLTDYTAYYDGENNNKYA